MKPANHPAIQIADRFFVSGETRRFVDRRAHGFKVKYSQRTWDDKRIETYRLYLWRKLKNMPNVSVERTPLPKGNLPVMTYPGVVIRVTLTEGE